MVMFLGVCLAPLLPMFGGVFFGGKNSSRKAMCEEWEMGKMFALFSLTWFLGLSLLILWCAPICRTYMFFLLLFRIDHGIFRCLMTILFPLICSLSLLSLLPLLLERMVCIGFLRTTIFSQWKMLIFENNGIFSVKNAHKLAMSLENAHFASSSGDIHQWSYNLEPLTRLKFFCGVLAVLFSWLKIIWGMDEYGSQMFEV